MKIEISINQQFIIVQMLSAQFVQMPSGQNIRLQEYCCLLESDKDLIHANKNLKE